MPESDPGTLQVIVLALVADGKNCDDVAALDFEERDIPCGAERDNEFAQERAGTTAGLSIAERGLLKTGKGVTDGFQRPLGQLPVRRIAMEDELI